MGNVRQGKLNGCHALGFSILARRRIRRPLRRAALFLWIIPFSAALSKALMAASVAVRASAGVPSSMVVRASLTNVRARPGNKRLRRRRLWVCLIRLIADLVLANLILQKLLLDCGRLFYLREANLSRFPSPESLGVVK